jgi:MGT family glycosyltransferase
MAKIIFINFPGHGHVNPTLPVVAELVRRGYEVIYYNSEEFRSPIERTGVTFRPYPEPSLTSAGLAHIANNLVNVTRLILSESKRLLPFLLQELEREQPDVVVFDSNTLWGMQAAHLLQLPSIASISTFVQEDVKGLMTWRDVLHLLRRALPAVPDLLRRKRELIGIYGPEAFPHKDVFPAIGEENIVYTSRASQPETPFINDSFHFVGPSINLATRTDTEFPWEQIRQSGRTHGRPLIYISLGTIYHLNAHFYQMLFDAFRDHPGQFVLSAGTLTNLATLDPIPDNFIVRNTVPQLELLPYVDLFITHGGMNSVNEGLYYGIPLVVIPQQMEQLLNARQVVAHGAGLILGERPPYGRTTGQELLQATERLLFDDRFRQNAQRLSASFQETGGFVAAADLIERKASRKSKPTQDAAVALKNKHILPAHS